MRNKTDLYAKEQDALIEEILRILELDEHRSWVLYDVENDPDKQNRLMGLIPSIRKFLSFSTIRNIVNPLQTAMSVVSKLSEGDFTVQIDINKNDELGKMLLSIHDMVDHLSASISQIRKLSLEIGKSSSELGNVSANLNNSSQDMACLLYTSRCV